MSNKENQVVLLKLQELKGEQPEAFRSRRAASEFFSRLSEQKEIEDLERKYLERAQAVLSHPALKTFARQGEITFAFIKPKAFEGKNMNFDTLNDDEKDDLAADKIRRAIMRETIDGGGEILLDINVRLTSEQARKFYDGLDKSIGKEKFEEVVKFMTSGPLTILLLRHFKRDDMGRKIIQNNAVDWWRKRIGATNPAKAGHGTIRGRFGIHIGNNIVHGSDSKQSVIREIGVIAEAFKCNTQRPEQTASPLF